MKRLSVLVVVMATIVGCATFGVFPKTNDGFIYQSSINPDDIENGKYRIIEGGPINPWVFAAFYYQPEKDRVVGTILVYNDKLKDLMLVRLFYIENGRLIIVNKNEEKKTWEKVSLEMLEIDPKSEVMIIDNLVSVYERFKKTEKL